MDFLTIEILILIVFFFFEFGTFMLKNLKWNCSKRHLISYQLKERNNLLQKRNLQKLLERHNLYKLKVKEG